MVETGNAMTTTNNNAVEKKRRKRNKKNKKKGSESSHVNAVSTAGEEDDSDEDEDAILDYLNMSMSTAASGAMQSQSASSGNLAMQDLNAYQSNHMDDPVSQTIGEVTQLSNGAYTLDRVTACVHRMWDFGMQYDNIDAVLKELKKEDDAPAKKDNSRSFFQEAPVSSSSPPEVVETQHVADVTSLVTASTMSKEDSSFPSSSTPLSTVSPPLPPAPLSTVPASQPDSHVEDQSQPEYSLSTRLELAASHPDISEALVALETWCRLVGPATASKEFFECQALEILLQNLISSPTLIQNEEVKDVLISLFLHVFPSPSNEEAKVNSSILVSELENFFVHLSQLHSLQISSEKSSPLAIRLSDSLRAVHSVFMSEQDVIQDKGSQHVIDSEIAARKKSMSKLQKQIAGESGARDDIAKVECSGSNIRNILELSDVTQDLLNLQMQKHVFQVSTAGKKSVSQNKPAVVSSITGSVSDDKKLEASILASSGASRTEIDNLKAQASSISTYYDRLSSEHDSILAPYRRDFIKCNETLTNLQQNYQYMQLQLKNIENEMNMVKSQANSIQADMSKIKLQQEARMIDLTSSHADVVQAIEKDREMQLVLENVRTLENSWSKSTNEIWGGVTADRTPSVVERPNASELEGVFENYVLAEMKCTEFLCKRNSLMIEKAVLLEREIVEYTNLGMKNLATDISKSIDVLKENRQEDLSALAGIQESIYSNMSEMKKLNIALSQPTKSFIHKIATSLKGAGVSVHPDIADYLFYQPVIKQHQQHTQAQQPSVKQPPVVVVKSTESGNQALPLPPRKKKEKEAKVAEMSTPPQSTTKSRVVTPPPGLGTTVQPQQHSSPVAPSWGGWGSIPKVTEPFKISKESKPKK